MSSKIPGDGKFYVGLANPATEAIRDMSAKDRKWEMRALADYCRLGKPCLGTKSLIT